MPAAVFDPKGMTIALGILVGQLCVIHKTVQLSADCYGQEVIAVAAVDSVVDVIPGILVRKIVQTDLANAVIVQYDKVCLHILPDSVYDKPVKRGELGIIFLQRA